jgi:hypothetical protein
VPAADAPPATQALAGGAPSPEQMGAVPRPDDVPAAAAPAETAEAAEAGMGPEWRAKEQAPGTPTEPPTGP